MKKLFYIVSVFISIANYSQIVSPDNTLTKKLDFITNGSWNTVTTPSNVNDFRNGYTFAYQNSGSPWMGPFISFGGLSNNYDCQINSSYYSNNISFRTRNGDTSTWNNWNELWHSGNLNNDKTDFIAKDLFSNSHTVSSYSPIVFLKRNIATGGYTQGIQTQLLDGTNNWYFGNLHNDSWIVAKGDYTGQLFTIKENGRVGIGTTNPTEKLEIEEGNISIKLTTNEGPALSLYNPKKTAAGSIWKMYNMTGPYGNSLQFWNYPSDYSTANQRLILHDNGNMDIKGNLTALGDIMTAGQNSWIFHSPEDRKALYISPSENGNWNLNKALVLNDGNAAVNGKLEAKEIKVTTTPTADFVFEPNYKLPKLEDLEKHIAQKKHLPEIASAKQMEAEGVNIGEFQIKLLQKIEELTLYTIQQNKRILELERRIKNYKNNK